MPVVYTNERQKAKSDLAEALDQRSDGLLPPLEWVQEPGAALADV